MATYTDNYNLIKPTYAETADIVPLNNNFEKIDEVMHASQTSLAPAYDQAASYQPGDVVMYELNMYKCTGATSGAWDPSKWTRTTAAETGGGGSVDFDIFGEGSGSVVTITDGAEAGLAECIVDIEATQSGSGTPSPSNVRPIVGRSEVNISVSGINKVPKGENRTNSGITFTVQDNGEVIVTGTASATAFWGVKFTIPKGTYTMTGCPSNGSSESYYVDIRNAVGGSGISGILADMGNGSTFTINEELTAYLNIRIASGYSAPSGGLTFSPMIRLSTAPEGFEPYNGSITTIPLDRTVYGGTLDVTRGVLTVTHTLITPTVVDGSGISGGLIYWIIPNINAPVDNVADLISSHFKPERGVVVGNTYITNYGHSLVIVLDQSITTVEQANAWLVTNNPQFCYKLATPQTYTLTAEEISTILGYNNISADSGEVSVVYVRQTAPIKPNPTGADIPLTGLEIDGEKFSIPQSGDDIEIIPITAGDGSTVRTFTFSKTPKFIKIYWEDTVLDGGWIADFEIVWGQPFVDYKAHARYVSHTGMTGGCASIAYPSDNKSMILTGGNTFGACNTPNGSGLMYVQY